ncbi:MAG TPA: hypothetical protein VGO11_06200 [Chthoniobacteraceae bacterium]|jgi:hypothetical protein|nr:hypothetical protein [Chthoniobacteraceae bacterium]
MSIRGVAPHRPPPGNRPGYGPAVAAPASEDRVTAAVPAGTAFAVFGCLVTAIFAQAGTASGMARFGAYGLGISLAGSVLMDFRVGLRNLIRADLLALAALYFLVFFEFLFPQERFDLMVTPETAHTGITAVAVGAIGILVGRHLWKPKQRPLQSLLTREIPPHMLLIIFWSSMAIGYLHMLLAVDFDVVKLIDNFMGPRFSQPWARGKFGDWKALLYELGLFIYLLPPLGGIMLARRERYSKFSLVLVMAAVGFTFFFGFSGGTRNILASYLVTFLIGYAFAAGPKRQKEMSILCTAGVAVALVASQLMLQFRNDGMKNWLAAAPVPAETAAEREMFVDYNLYAICRLIETFPKNVHYLGWEIPYAAIIRPIPRAMWPSKPEGLTSSIEDPLGVENMTISATFVGEAYMSGGLFAVALAGLAFGALFGWWNYVASLRNSEMGILIYSSGFFAAVISMRSMLVFTTALLPTGAAILLGWIVVRQAAALERLRLRLLKSRTPAQNIRSINRNAPAPKGRPR